MEPTKDVAVAEEFDVSAYELEDVATLVVQNAKGNDVLLYKGNPVTIELFGSGSRQAVKALHKAGQQAQIRLQQLLRGKTDPQAAETADREMVEKLVACTSKINNFPVKGGATGLYTNPKLGYITKQVTAFLSDDANFAKPSTTASASSSDKAPG